MSSCATNISYYVGRRLGLWVDGHLTINGLWCGQDEESVGNP